MSFSKFRLYCSLAALMACVPAYAGTKTHHHAASSHSSAAHRSSNNSRRSRHRVKGQQAIASDRVTQIQQALIREHYMSGDATGEWDSSTQAAMQKYQADQGWQTKLMPDSRAIKKLGLGPDYSTAINAKTASFGTPPPISTIPASQAAGFAAAAHTDR